MTPLRALVDGVPGTRLPVTDRGFCYGDGLFETIRIAAGQPVWWEAHLARLARGCAALGLEMPDPALLAAELGRLCDGTDGVLRLTLTRGDGARGYLPAVNSARRVLALHPPPAASGERAHQDAPHAGTARNGHVAHRDPLAASNDHGAHPDAPANRGAAPLAVGWARLQLAIQPRLAGLKHLNRLEQVLAARECRDAGLDELLLCDAEGAVTSGVAGNLFLVRDGRLHTPALDRCGVAGTCRAWVLEQHPDCHVGRIGRAEVESADELFLCNSVRGILPVARLAARRMEPGPVTQALVRRLGSAVPAFAAEPEQ